MELDHPDAVSLRDQMVAEVAQVYGGQRDHGDDHGGNHGASGIDPSTVLVTLVGDVDGSAVAHGLLRRLGDDVEIKRMYVLPAARGAGLAGLLLVALEDEARSLGIGRLVLHTGERQVAAIRTYEQHGYLPIPVYEPYVGMSASLCFAKRLTA